MRLDKLIQNIEIISISGNPENVEIETVENISQKVNSGTLFVAIKGFKSDGHNYLNDAISKGAKAVVVTEENQIPDELFVTNNVVKIVVKDSRKVFAELSCEIFGHPSRELKLIGITGSNGKTTTTFYIKNLLETAGYKSGLLGTISNIVGEQKEDSSLTTPDSNIINNYLRQMVDNGYQYCVMEVSSHALVLDRVHGLDFDYAIFTNISSDHLDFHKDIENYIRAKKILFDNLKEDAVIIYNGDDENSKKVIADSAAKEVAFGKRDNSDYQIKNIEFDLDGTRFELNRDFKFNTKLIGEFNAYNASSAAIIGEYENLEKNIIEKGINTTPQVPGRFEVISNKNKKVIVDYSHTADSLQKALQAIEKIVNGKHSIHTVFGCGGDRDKTKRPVMGSIADKMSDKIYVTSDNPRSENPNQIIEDILEGIKRENPFVNSDREVAIKEAICNSEADAVILIAGKGHEEYQLVNGVKHHFSDKETAEKYLELCA